jgi:hypothetical protein
MQDCPPTLSPSTVEMRGVPVPAHEGGGGQVPPPGPPSWERLRIWAKFLGARFQIEREIKRR